MWKYAVCLSYVGTFYCGWQRQKVVAAKTETPSIQGTIEDILSQMTSEKISLVGSGRTDAGVHAIGQVAHFKLTQKRWKPEILLKGLNSILPATIRALDLCEVLLDFHAQRSVIQKQYSYYFQQGSCAVPFLAPYSWWIQKKLDIQKMSEALMDILGEHDFKPFQASGAKPIPTQRTIIKAEINVFSVPRMEKYGVTILQLRIVGTGFLKQMVRGIVGTLVQIGEGRRETHIFSEILKTGHRSLVGPTAPARALWLEQVEYPKEIHLFPSTEILRLGL